MRFRLIEGENQRDKKKKFLKAMGKNPDDYNKYILHHIKGRNIDNSESINNYSLIPKVYNNINGAVIHALIHFLTICLNILDEEFIITFIDGKYEEKSIKNMCKYLLNVKQSNDIDELISEIKEEDN